ncbi:MAG: hypothetical protein IPM54_36480 [Polyangiaceae bacterium]|nr:hypothetical protein [Polyangiaceae bacterium]
MNRHHPRRPISLLLATAISFSGSFVHASDASREKAAQEFFVDAMKMMSAKRYADACEKFARSLELDPGMGTQFRLAECYEKLGRLASAYEQYLAVADAAKEAQKKDRELVARKRADALEPRVARLTIVIGAALVDVPGLEVVRDGAVVPKELWGTPIYIDPGDHVVTIKATGRLPLESKLWAEGAARLVVNITSLEKPPPPAAPPRSKVPAIAMGAGGGLGIILGATFLGIRAAKISEAEGLRDTIQAAGGHCRPDRPAEYAGNCDALSSATSTGDALGTSSIISFVVGAGALGAMGAYLLWPQPTVQQSGSVKLRWFPTVTPGQTGLTVSGTF